MSKIVKSVIFIALFALFPSLVSGQNLDSLYAIIDSGQEDTVRIKTMLHTSQVLQSTDHEEAVYQANSASILAVQSKEYKLAAQSFNQLGLLAYFQGQLKDCKAYFEEAMTYYELAEIPLGVASAGNNIGVIEYEQGFNYNALNYFAESLVIRKANNDSASISVSYNNIGNVYKDLNELHKAKDFYQKSIDMKLILEDDFGLAMTYNNLGQVYHELENYDKAIELYDTSIELKEKIGDDRGLGMTYCNKGNSQKEQGYFELAEVNIKKSAQLRTELDDQFGLLHSNLSLAQLYAEEEDFVKAEGLFLESLNEAKEMLAFVQVKDAYFGLYQCYEADADFEKALDFHKRYAHLNDSLNTAKNLKVSKQVEIELEVADKDEQIQELTDKVENQKPFWKEPWFEFLLLFLTLVISITVVFIFLNKNARYSDRDYYKIDQLKTLRLLFFSAAIMAPLLGYYRSSTSSISFDPIGFRLLASVLILIPLIGSYRSQRIRDLFEGISFQLFYIITSFLVFLVYKNSFASGYLIDLLILSTAAPAIFGKLRQLVFYLLFYLGSTFTVFVITENAFINFSEFAISIFITTGVSTLVFLAKLNSQRQLNLSNEIVNEVDALVLIANDQGKHIYASKSIKDILGYEPQEALKNDIYTKIGFSASEEKDSIEKLSLLATGQIQPKINEFQAVKTKQGELKWIFWKDKRIDGNRVLSIGQDVTERKEILDELKESEGKFRQMNETLSEVFYLYNIEEAKYEYISPGCESVMGAEADFFYEGLSHQKLYVLKDDLRLVEDANVLVNSGKSYEIEYRILVDNEIRWVREKSFPIENEDGKVYRNSGICQDITEFKRNEEELHKLSLVASTTTNYILIAHVERGIEWVNEAFEEKFGYTEEEVIGKYPSEVLHNKDSKVINIIDKVVFKLGEKFSGEIVHLTREGKKVYAKVDVIPIRNNKGEIDKYFVLGVDISDQKDQEREINKAHGKLKLKEAQLAESDLNFRQLIKSIKQVFWLSDFKTRKPVFVSESYERIFGVKAQTLIDDPRSWSYQIHSDDLERVLESFKTHGADGDFSEVYRIVVDDKVKWVNSKIYLVHNEAGEPIMISGVTEDITDKKLQEIELESLGNRLSVIHAIEQTILTSETTEEIIYNSLDKTLLSLPILRASLALFDYNSNDFYSYTATEGTEDSLTDKKVFSLDDFSAHNELQKTKSHILTNIRDKSVKSKTDLILIEEGVNAILMSPLFHGEELIGSFNVCFKDGVEKSEGLEDYIGITKEVANGLAIAIQQSKLKDLIESNNKEITSSINYAKMIQEAHIPKDLNHNGIIPNHTLFFRPKDIVSGDFYWTEEVGDNLVVVIGDCTGHGVPGAFMTVIGINILSTIVSHHKITDPGMILDKLNDEIIKSLTTERDIQIQDGMDVGVCVFNKKDRTLKFAGAKRPLIHMCDGELKEIPASKFSIGTDFEKVEFNTQDIACGKENRFYIFSDGFPDQFGGPDVRKFNRRRVYSLIEDIHQHDFQKQTELINQAFDDWKGNNNQTDDVVFAGFEF